MPNSHSIKGILLFLCLALQTGGQSAAAQGPLRAITEDGRPVILEADGSWRFDNETQAAQPQRLALSVPRLQDVANGCRVSLHLTNLMPDQAIGNFTPRVAFWRSDRITPEREIMRFRDVAPRGTSELTQVLRYTACSVLTRIEISALQDSCVLGGQAYEDFECLEWTRADPGALAVSLPSS